MSSLHQQRHVRFTVVDFHLVRTEVFPDGRGYGHRGPEDAFTQVAHAVDEAPAEGEGLSLERLAQALNLPFTQVNVAMAFLKDRGVLEVRARRSYRASDTGFEDAMCEYHALTCAGREGR